MSKKDIDEVFAGLRRSYDAVFRLLSLGAKSKHLARVEDLLVKADEHMRSAAADLRKNGRRKRRRTSRR